MSELDGASGTGSILEDWADFDQLPVGPTAVLLSCMCWVQAEWVKLGTTSAAQMTVQAAGV